MNGEDRKRPGRAWPLRPPRGAGLGDDAPEAPDERTVTRESAIPGSPVDRLERERRRAVRAEGRLAEIELTLRHALDRANGDGISAPALRSLLEAVHSRVASLEDEVRASERELLDIVAAQRRSLGAMATDREELAYGLERARQELREAAQEGAAGLPELTRQRVDFEIEIDRLQSLLTHRDSVCDGLTDDLEEGARVAAEVAQRLAELARGRVAAPRRSLVEDARLTALRGTLENERAELQQARRALEAARAELKVAQRGVIEVEEKATGRLAPLEQQLRELHAERDRLSAEVEAARASAAAERVRLEQALDRERAARVQANEAVRILEKRFAELERQLTISGEEREDGLRARLAESEKDAERIEAERIRLAERVSLLQASLAAKDAEIERANGSTAERAAPKAKVVPLVANETAPPVESPSEAASALRERQSDLDKLSGRWRRLQAAYQEAVAEFDEVRAKRDRLARRFPDAGYAPGSGNPQRAPAPSGAGTGPAAPAAEPPVAGPPSTANREAERPADEWLIEESAPRRTLLVQLDERPELVGAMRRLAADRRLPFRTGAKVDVPAGAQLIVAANLMAERVDVLPSLVDLSRGGRVPRALLYGATREKGRILGVADVFPAPFDPVVCAAHLLGGDSRLRRVMTVGEFADMMSRLRELLGRSRCSTAVAFDRRQALDLVTLVRPEYVLVDLALADGAGLDLLLELGRHTDPPVKLGVTWSRPIAGQVLRAAVEARLGEGLIPQTALAEAIDALVAGEAR